VVRIGTWMIAGVLAVSTACTHGHGAPETGPAPVATVRLKVTNYYSEQLDVYAVTPSTTRRLGSVPPGLTKNLFIPRDVFQNESVEVQVQSTGGGAVRTTTDYALTAGDLVEVTVTTHFELLTDVSHP
jgi:hypothetical protein